ncbi:DgyrCDS13324 [Dimorphilus gyrociliatus]|uniref:DgyrCDS13324 n=1 Tax=Dimorphilus gyrociliatus TaxID=2664684 RepID=A0A7I8WAB4_9ANNE|nr:DgyrCDS13324 [Dimorphilus gyrociliatus]
MSRSKQIDLLQNRDEADLNVEVIYDCKVCRSSKLDDSEKQQKHDSTVQLFKIAEYQGDVNSRLISKLLYQDRACVNCQNDDKHTVLHKAIIHENIIVLNILLKSNFCNNWNIYNALLLAISRGSTKIAEDFIKTNVIYEKIKMYAFEKETKGLETDGSDDIGEDTNLFMVDVTPIMLASQKNQFSVVKLLYARAERISERVLNKRKFELDELKFSRTKLNVYRALASDTYLCIGFRSDPIFKSFELAKKMDNLSITERHFRKEYQQLKTQLGGFVCRLLDRVRHQEELSVILKEQSGLINLHNESDDETNNTMPRLKLAVQYGLKKFVVHPSVQRKVQTRTYDNPLAEHLFNTNIFCSFLNLIPFIFLYLLATVFYLIYPFNTRLKVKTFLKTPIVKFLSNLIVSVGFVIIILIHSIREDPSYHIDGSAARISTHPKLSQTFCTFLSEQTMARNKTSGQLIKDYCSLSSIQKREVVYPFKDIDGVKLGDEFIRNYSFQVTFWIIMILVIGFAFRYGRLVYHDTLVYFLRNWYNVFGLISMILYMLYIVFVIYTRARVIEAIDYFNRTPTAWRDLLYSNNSEAERRWSNIPADRRLWPDSDLGIIGEICFSVGCLSMFLSFFSFFIANEHIGPLVISLVRMGGEMIRFSVLLITTLLSFILIFVRLYMNFAPKNRSVIEVDFDVKSFQFGEDGDAGYKFGSFMSAFRTLFWGTFGMASYFDVEIAGENNPNNLDYRTPTVFAGYIMFGIYHWATVILLINMLIAMMTRSYDRIASDEDIEWKYARTRLYLDYMQTDTLCVPFNVIPTLKTLIRVCRWIKYIFMQCFFSPNKKKRGLKRSLKSTRSDDIDRYHSFFKHNLDTDNTKGKKLTYEMVMKRLISRFWNSKSTRFEEDTKLERESPKLLADDANNDMSTMRKEINHLMEMIKQRDSTTNNFINNLMDLQDLMKDIDVKSDEFARQQVELRLKMENFSCDCPCWELMQSVGLVRNIPHTSDLQVSESSTASTSRLVGVRLMNDAE